MKGISNELEEIVREIEESPKEGFDKESEGVTGSYVEEIKEDETGGDTEDKSNNESKDGNGPVLHIKKKSLRRIIILLLIVITIASASFAYFIYENNNTLNENFNLSEQKESEKLVSVLGKLIELPKGETPTIATVLDKDKLKGQEFFANVENGDKLFIYNLEKKAILYRESLNKIINVAQVSVNQTQAPINTIPTEVATSTVLNLSYYNGTGIDGLAKATEKTVKSKYPDWKTTILAGASKSDYKETLVIDISGGHNQEVKELAYLLSGRVATLPEGETTKNTDILIIVGK